MDARKPERLVGDEFPEPHMGVDVGQAQSSSRMLGRLLAVLLIVFFVCAPAACVLSSLVRGAK